MIVAISVLYTVGFVLTAILIKKHRDFRTSIGTFEHDDFEQTLMCLVWPITLIGWIAYRLVKYIGWLVEANGY